MGSNNRLFCAFWKKLDCPEKPKTRFLPKTRLKICKNLIPKRKNNRFLPKTPLKICKNSIPKLKKTCCKPKKKLVLKPKKLDLPGGGRLPQPRVAHKKKPE